MKDYFFLPVAAPAPKIESVPVVYNTWFWTNKWVKLKKVKSFRDSEQPWGLSTVWNQTICEMLTPEFCLRKPQASPALAVHDCHWLSRFGGKSMLGYAFPLPQILFLVGSTQTKRAEHTNKENVPTRKARKPLQDYLFFK